MTVGLGRYDTRAPCRGDYDGRLRVKRIPISSVHRLRTPGKIPLEIIEVQSGRYLGEDDIERFEDVYSRSTPGIEAGVRTQTIAR